MNEEIHDTFDEPVERQDAPDIMMFPPTMLVAFIAAGLTLNWAVGLFAAVAMAHGWGWLGLLLVAVAFAFTGKAKKLFDKAGTNVNPQQPAHAIVSDGPFAYSRNPMYLSMLVGYAGMAFLAGAPVMLLLLFPLFYLLDQKIIVSEEEYLAEKFGDEYLKYKTQVRRWL